MVVETVLLVEKVIHAGNAGNVGTWECWEPTQENAGNVGTWWWEQCP